LPSAKEGGGDSTEMYEAGREREVCPIPRQSLTGGHARIGNARSTESGEGMKKQRECRRNDKREHTKSPNIYRADDARTKDRKDRGHVLNVWKAVKCCIWEEARGGGERFRYDARERGEGRFTGITGAQEKEKNVWGGKDITTTECPRTPGNTSIWRNTLTEKVPLASKRHL